MKKKQYMIPTISIYTIVAADQLLQASGVVFDGNQQQPQVIDYHDEVIDNYYDIG